MGGLCEPLGLSVRYKALTPFDVVEMMTRPTLQTSTLERMQFLRHARDQGLLLARLKSSRSKDHFESMAEYEMQTHGLVVGQSVTVQEEGSHRRHRQRPEDIDLYHIRDQNRQDINIETGTRACFKPTPEP